MADARLRIVIDALNLAKSEMGNLEKELAGVESQAKKSGSAMDAIKSVKSIMADVTGAVAGFGATWKVAMDFGKAGADLNLMQDKFNRLAVSIGSTGDSLSSRLSAAMNGTVSNAKMVESAVTLMNLGLAKSQDEVVRMSSVSQKLNWDMQVLGLTIANESTMRLDALGLSIEEVVTRQKALVAQGMSTSAAFREAIVAAGEAKAQLLGMGEGSANATQSFARLEAATSNIVDSLKMKLAPALANAAEAGALLLTWNDKMEAAQREHSTQVAKTAETYEDYIAEMQRARSAVGQQIDAEGRLVETRYDGVANTEAFAMAQIAMTRAQWEAQRAVEGTSQALLDQQQATRAANEAMGLYDSTLDGGVIPSEKTLASFTAVATDAMRSRRAMMVDITGAAISLTEQEQRRSELERELATVIGGTTAEQIKQRDAIQATLDQMQRAAEIEAAKSAFESLGIALKEGVLSEEAYREAMMRMNDATGLFSDKSLAMATSSALMNDAIRKARVPEDVIAALLRYGDALGSAAQRSLGFAGAPEANVGNQRVGGEVIPQASGGDWMVTRPTLFLAGEAGPERATFTPQASSSVNNSYQYGGDTIIVNDTRTWALIQAEKRRARTLDARNG